MINLFSNPQHYEKINQPWQEQQVNIPENRFSDQILRSNVGSNHSFLSSFLVCPIMNQMSAAQRARFLKTKRKEFMETLTQTQFTMDTINYLACVWNTIQSYSNSMDTMIKDMTDDKIQEKLLDIIWNNMNKKESFFAQFLSRLKETKDITTVLREVYFSNFREEFEKIDSSVNRDKSKKFKDMVGDALSTLAQKIEEDSFLLYRTDYFEDHHLSPKHLLSLLENTQKDVACFVIDHKTNSILKTTQNDIERKRIVCLYYFEKDNSYERIFYDSYNQPSDFQNKNDDFFIKTKGKGQYRYYYFDLKHEYTRFLLSSKKKIKNKNES